MQALERIWFTPKENVPSGQSVQELAEVDAAYVPAEQGVHALAPASEYVPAPHDRHALAPAVAEYVPAGQGVHTDRPALTLYVPVGQVVQITFCEATHAELAYDPARQMVLLLHVIQYVMPVSLGMSACIGAYSPVWQ